MKKTTIFLVLVIVSIITSYGQTNAPIKQSVLNEMVGRAAHRYSINKNGSTVEYTLEEIEGTPYLTEKHELAKIILNNEDTINSVKLNYNIFTDNFEFIRNSISFILTNNYDIKEIYYNNKIFVYQQYKDENGQNKLGYFERMIIGKCNLYKKFYLNFLGPEVPETQFNEPLPARFQEKEPKYFLRFESENEIEKIMTLRKGKFGEYFRDESEIIYQYIKEEKLKLTDENDLKKVIKYYNQL